MRKRLLAAVLGVAAVLACTFVFGLSACAEKGEVPDEPVKDEPDNTEPSDGDNEEPAKTYKINCIEDDAYIITAPEEAEEGEEVTVTVQLDDVDNYIERVTYDRYNAEYTPGYDCEPDKDGGYTFTMPDFDVELKVEVGTFEEVLKGGMSGFAEFVSERTISADSGEARLIVKIGAGKRYNVGATVISSNQSVIPAEAVTTEVSRPQTEIDSIAIVVDTSLISKGVSWFVIDVIDFQAQTYSTRLVVRLTVN